MKKLHQLAKELKNNNFEMTDNMKEQFEEFLSTIAIGSRILHPRFGLGTVTGTRGNNWIEVSFDSDNNIYEKKLKQWEEEQKKRELMGEHRTYWGKPYKKERAVLISSCISIHMLIKKERLREIQQDFK